MNNLFSRIPPELFPSTFNLLQMFLSSALTYLLMRAETANPKHYEIKEKQFDLVYLPLYLITVKYLKGTDIDLNCFISNADEIFNANLPLVFPKTLRQFECIRKSPSNTYVLMSFYKQVLHDYESLRRFLGYPTNSFISLFSRMNIIDFVVLMMKLVMVSLLVYTITASVQCFLTGDITNAVTAFFCIPFIAFLLYIISYATKY